MTGVITFLFLNSGKIHIPDQEHVALNLHLFAEDILLPGKEKSAERSGATVKDFDDAGRKDISAQRVCFWRPFAVLHHLNDAPHRPARCALQNDTPKTNKVKQI
ncbi:hypothetical protein [Thalassospira profundimaris]|uniref:hypothetical protein n=1 Tax=Thalassospira profundimaris TaxID=502049 RepID=UPI0002873E4E|nr:hypothetical protein [Thalassospira profundimaris]EKF10401.1 hypothetical protein TH2_03505 [Thalassospira profundimaris WP0211]